MASVTPYLQKPYSINVSLINAPRAAAEECTAHLGKVVAAALDTLDETDTTDSSYAGSRTFRAELWLESEPSYSCKNKSLVIGRTRYFILTSSTKDFCSYPLASVGGNERREVILLDPKRSPYLQDQFAMLNKLFNLRNTTKKASESQTIELICELLREKVFKRHHKHVDTYCMTDGLTKHHTIREGRVPCISIDRFIKLQSGLCRHQALVAAYLINRLINKSHLSGQVRHIRHVTPTGAHAWCLYVGQREAALIDPAQHQYYRNIRETAEVIIGIYGKKAFDHMIHLAECMWSDC